MFKASHNTDLLIVEKYFKIIYFVNINSLWPPQFKSYLKILGLPYITDKTKLPINSNIIEAVLKEMLLFNNDVLALKPQIIKVFPKSNMAVVWVDI